MYFIKRVTKVQSVLSGIHNTSLSMSYRGFWHLHSQLLLSTFVPCSWKSWNSDFGTCCFKISEVNTKILIGHQRKIISEFFYINQMSKFSVVIELIACDWVKVVLFLTLCPTSSCNSLDEVHMRSWGSTIHPWATVAFCVCIVTQHINLNSLPPNQDGHTCFPRVKPWKNSLCFVF